MMGRASAEHVYYWKCARPAIDTTDPLYFGLKVSIAWFWLLGSKVKILTAMIR